MESCFDLTTRRSLWLVWNFPGHRRQYEHYAGLFFQSGQWHAILLMLVEEVSEPERMRYLGEIDGFLEELRGGLVRG